MNPKNLNRITGFFVFLVTAIVYFTTVQPSVSFWDCGEFIASAFSMQVPHPPGTPFFLLVGRLFSMIPFAENIAFRVNTVSVLTSAFNILFLYLIAVKLIENYKGKASNNFEAFITYISAAIGALSLAFADTYWFNAVEAEVYASSVFFIGFVTWLIMVWNEKADEPDSEKYIIMIFYLIGISTGVHLMAVLAIVPVVMIIMFKKYVTDYEVLKNTGFIFLGNAALALMIAMFKWAGEKATTNPSPEVYKDFDQSFLAIQLIASAIFIAIFYKKLFNRNSFYIPIIVGGIALVMIYPGMVKYIPNLLASTGGNNILVDISILLLMFAVLVYIIYWSQKEDKGTINLAAKAILFSIIGFTSYTTIILRANQDTPINLNSPKTVTEVVSYLNREQYGDFPTFQRRYSGEPHQRVVFSNYSSDLDFWWSYQMDHMFVRYLEWNYIGRESTVQDAGVDWTKFYAIPFFFAILGLYFHFRNDWKMASVFLVMFIFLGFLTAFYQNQQQPQPRERDYFYVGAFFVFSIWIALGVRGTFDLISQYMKESSAYKAVAGGLALLLFLAIPVNMLAKNYFEHDRSRNYVPWDYSYNMLQSVAPNAIIFTNGDNDTFPLWYLQDVEGVRRDVRIANLSLLNTDWYIKQLKNTTPYNTEPVPMSVTDADIARIGPSRWEPREISVPVPDNVYEKYGITDTTVINKGTIDWVMPNTIQYGDIKAIRVQDIIALDIIRANNWQRPIYFAVTVSDDSRIGLTEYLQMEGMALKITPQKFTEFNKRVNEPVLRAQLFDETDVTSRDYRPGFKFRGLNDSTIFFDENHERLTQNYRNAFMRLSLHYLYELKDYEMVLNTIDEMEQKMPRSVIPMDYRLLHDVGNIVYAVIDSVKDKAAAMDKYKAIARDVEKNAWARMKSNPRDISNRYSPYIILRDIYESTGEWDKLVQVFEKLQEVVPNDPGVQEALNRYRAMARLQNQGKAPEVKTPELQMDNN